MESPKKLKECGVRLLRDWRAARGRTDGGLVEIGQLGCFWDAAQRDEPGRHRRPQAAATTTGDGARIAELELDTPDARSEDAANAFRPAA